MRKLPLNCSETSEPYCTLVHKNYEWKLFKLLTPTKETHGHTHVHLHTNNGINRPSHTSDANLHLMSIFHVLELMLRAFQLRAALVRTGWVRL